MPVKTFVRILRAPFFTAVIVPTLVGTALALRAGFFNPWYFLLTLLGIVCINAGLNLSNDYFDHLSGDDAANHHLTPFSGGSRAIQEGLLSPRQVLTLSLAFYALGSAIGLGLTIARGWVILGLGVVGVFFALFHNAPPFKLYYLGPGVGELAAGIGCGPLVVLGSYYVQTQTLTLEALWISIPLGLLVTAILYGNEFPDYEADKAVGKKTMPVVFGRAQAARGYAWLFVGVYGVLLLGVALGILPWPALLGLLTLPLAFRGARGLLRYHSQVPELVPALGTTIQVHLATGLLLCVGYAVAMLL
jgi:1,4-dihydroxy-2-naphthoate polyprenyltransferase